MKVFGLLLTTSNALQCHTCHYVGEERECPLVACPSDGQKYACENEIRTHNGMYEIRKGKLITIFDSLTPNWGCKQALACSNNQNQNDKAAWVPTQCNPVFFANSVCRCCCSDRDGCNEENEFCFEGPDSKLRLLLNWTCLNWKTEPTCPAPPSKPNLVVTCSDGRKLDSECSLKCKNENFDLIGPSKVSCEMNKTGVAKWSPSFPRCEARCPNQAPADPATQVIDEEY